MSHIHGAESGPGVWHERDVARGHVVAAVDALTRPPEEVAPFRAFLDALGPALDRLPQPTRLLDLGCGVGHYGELLDRVHPNRFVYVGADFPAMVTEAQGAFPQRTYIVADLELGEPPLEGYDMLLASSSIPTLRDWRKALERLLASSAPLVFLHRQAIGWRTSTTPIRRTEAPHGT